MTNWELVPPGVVTVTWTEPDPEGAVTVSCVSDRTVNEVAAVAPKRTTVAVARPVPVTVTPVPAGPEAGVSEPTVGTAAANSRSGESEGRCAELFNGMILKGEGKALSGRMSHARDSSAERRSPKPAQARGDRPPGRAIPGARPGTRGRSPGRAV